MFNEISKNSNNNTSNYNVNLSNIEQVDFVDFNSDEDNDENPSKNNYIKNDYLSYQLNKLNEMVNFVENVIDCRHFQLSNYFGERTNEKINWCNGVCDNCIKHKDQTNIQEKDMTEHTLKLLEIINQFNETNINEHFINRKKINDYYQKNTSNDLSVSYLIIERLLNRMLNSNLIKENFILSSNSGLWFENIILTNEAAMEAAKAACVAAVEAYEAMTTEQRAEHDAAQTARILAEFQAMTPEQQAEHEAAVKAATEASLGGFTNI